MKIIQQYKTGIKYSELCSSDIEKFGVFPEIKIIKFYRLSKILMPPFIVLLIVIYFLFDANLVATLVASLFAFSIPFQAVYWLGFRANCPLTLNLVEWHNYLINKLKEKKTIAVDYHVDTVPNFYQLMNLFNLARQNLTDAEIRMEEEKYD